MQQFLALSRAVAAAHIFLWPVHTHALSPKQLGKMDSNHSDHRPVSARVIAVPAGGFDDGVAEQDDEGNRSWLEGGGPSAQVSMPSKTMGQSWPTMLAAKDPHVIPLPFRNHVIDPRTRYMQGMLVSIGGPTGGSNASSTLGNKELEAPALRNFTIFGFAVVLLFGLQDWFRWIILTSGTKSASMMNVKEFHAELQTFLKQRAEQDGSVDGEMLRQKSPSGIEPVEWSTFSLVALTSFRFYTGFVSATWLPYLLAMEGAYLYPANQSLFMGVAKLVYGVTILANPLFGLIGDRAVALSHGVGRRLFLRAGIVVTGCGMMVCVLADSHRYFYCFITGILLWRIGDALTDVTTEALVPELLPNSQYGAASIAKASQFLLGSIFGFVMLIIMRGYYYTWLYWAYAIGMIAFAIPCQVLLCDDSPRKGVSQRQSGPFMKTMEQAYLAPARLAGWFPRACLAVTSFSFGTSPMFFLLLMLRDLVGIVEPTQLDIHFSECSILFFVAAAVAVVINGVLDQRRTPPAPGMGTKNEAQQDPEILISRLTSVVKASMCYALVCIFLPMVCFFPTETTRYAVFAGAATVMGICFGSGFARFQDITWQVIPNGADVANCMGFNIMCRLFGVGLGNFAAGVMLDTFEYPPDYGDDSSSMLVKIYRPQGYTVMCVGSAAVCLICSYLCYTIARGLQKEIDESKDAHAVPAA